MNKTKTCFDLNIFNILKYILVIAIVLIVISKIFNHLDSNENQNQKQTTIIEVYPSINSNDGVAEAIRKSIRIKNYFVVSKSMIFEMSDGTYWQDITYWKENKKIKRLFAMKNYGRGFEVYKTYDDQGLYLSSKLDEGITIVKGRR